MKAVLQFSRFLTVVAFLSLAACGSDSSPTNPPPNNNPPPGPVTNAPVTSVELTGSAHELAIAHSLTLSATARDSAGRALTGRTISWKSSSEAVATVSQSGAVTAVAIGTSTITASAEGKNADFAITVTPTAVAAIIVAPDTATLKLGETRKLVATVKDDLGNVLTDRAVKWTTSNSAIASVDSATGMARGEDDGSVTITASADNKTGSAKLRVFAPVASVTIAPTLDTLEAWDVRQMTAILKDAKGRVLTGRDIAWQVSDSAIAKLSNVGVLTGLDRGTVTITATSESISATVRRVVVIKYRSLSVGAMHACDLASGGVAWCWGLNGREGRIGITTLGDQVQSSVPVPVPGGLRFTQLATFGRHTCALTRDGKAYCWGYNGSNVLGVTGMNQSATPVAVSGGITFKQITTGSEHTCGLAIDGQAYCWGFNSSGELGDGTKIAKGTPTLVAGGLTFTSITAGSGATCAVAPDRSLYCWGSNVLGQLGDGQPIAYGGGASSTVPKRVVGGFATTQAGAGLQYACAITTSNQTMCWGSNNGKFGNGSSTDSSIPQPVTGGLLARSISTGYAHSCLVTMSNEVWCWGDNHHGELGNPVGSGSNKPVRAGGSLLAADVSSAGIGTGSGANTCSVSPDRLTVTCWGQNDVGQLGNGATNAVGTSTTTPAIVVSQKPLPPQ